MRLGHYLRAVSQGKIFTVTSRGKPVARLGELASEGILTWNAGNFRLPEPVAVNKGPELLSDLVVKGRG
jgi:antitoxin (DNA-binding transcriptional repressor) of toxin-antitoxin stability system